MYNSILDVLKKPLDIQHIKTVKSKTMKTVTVELKNINALKLLKDLERANIIRVLDKDKKKVKNRPSESLRGAISKERAIELNEQLTQMRSEWEDRNI